MTVTTTLQLLLYSGSLPHPHTLAADLLRPLVVTAAVMQPIQTGHFDGVLAHFSLGCIKASALFRHLAGVLAHVSYARAAVDRRRAQPEDLRERERECGCVCKCVCV